MNNTRVFSVTTKNIKRNKWLTISTILVSAIVFTLTSVFISASLILSKTVDYYEQRAQVIVFFKKGTEESEIFKFREQINNPEIIDELLYISQEEALEVYKQDFADNPELISTVTADSLPPSLEIRAKSIDSLLTIIEDINIAKESNPNIDDVMYFKDVVNNIKTLSNIINVGGIALISSMILITIALIRVTIGFNIKIHQEEIEIMHLVGSPDKFIRTPFILEGAIYGFVGALLATIIILIPWYSANIYSNGTEFSTWITEMFKDINLSYVLKPDITFIPIYLFIHLIAGSIIGLLSSLSAVKKYLKD
ncbi:FtsX-like permease family protein [Candidatus Dojkabacteria bacterium]|uniref:Cell division protein FtsX n=1 Tax=Candidatus Dojkabacteria bacterium TaxID=2099670 RepID=A0A847ESI5_9BACT|nr:FtsX-like permease family protein [Candidatus Dojkabacteria bacterium]